MAIQVTLVYSPSAREIHEEILELPRSCTAYQALQASDLLRRCPAVLESGASLGIWGKKIGLSQALSDGDRLELYRPLQVDPKVARRARFEAQGARAAGLFSRRRAGAKAGY